MCADKFEFILNADDQFGIAPSTDDSKPDLISALYAAGHLDDNVATLYLGTNVSLDDQDSDSTGVLEMGVKNSTYIDGDW